jgi:hypothetical protein
LRLQSWMLANEFLKTSILKDRAGLCLRWNMYYEEIMLLLLSYFLKINKFGG